MDFLIAYVDGRFELSVTGDASVSGYDDLFATLTTHKRWQPGSMVLSDETALKASHLIPGMLPKLRMFVEFTERSWVRQRSRFWLRETSYSDSIACGGFLLRASGKRVSLVCRSRSEAVEWLSV